MSAGPNPAEGARERFLSERYFSAFDGLRCLAICGVIWHHCLPGPREGWLGRGHAGVPLFFALSGFLITTLMLAEHDRTGDIALGAFWTRRTLRIFPLYYAVLAGFVVHLLLLPPSEPSRHFFASLPYYVTYTSNWLVDYSVTHAVWFGFAWSLAAEEQFYLAWPPLLRRCLAWGPWSAAAVLGCGVALDQLTECRLLFASDAVEGLPARMLASIASPMLLGALLAVLLVTPLGFRIVWTLLGRRASLPVCFALCAFLLAHPMSPPLLFDLSLAGLVAASALGSPSALGRCLAWSPIAHIGRVSYCMYLIHVPLLGIAKGVVPWLAAHPVVLFPFVLAASVAVGTLSQRHFEAPFTRLRARFRVMPPRDTAHQSSDQRSGGSWNVTPTEIPQKL
jgi:peptidoglycan/LPS O-acetylase OafA/YrhL